VQRILFREAVHFLKAGICPRWSEPFLDHAGAAFAVKIEQELAGVGFDKRRTIADYDSPLVVDEFERRNGPLRVG